MTSLFTRDKLAVYFIAGSQDTARPLREVVFEALRGGVTIFQLREKGEGSLQQENERLELALQMKELCDSFHVPLIINDDVELALQCNADGLHIGQEDMDPEEARKKMGDNKILGVSAYTVAEARSAGKYADYIGVGPMYETQSKADAKSAVGPSRIKMMREEGIQTPIVAIGGIRTDHVSSILQAGADGVSVISAIARAEAPESAAVEFVRETKKFTAAN
ncbi:thiamine phosphate synthase [Alkalicoccus daliensis]|uniref:Thiamine-phosphate synthase n=1 Tax=Alkalicoccus daliensis TaxID=745820 RepID=A0A1H0DYZ4_9BACI|nr:thiamine phosphate synthase [Alkalicoccus daliensis]SDN75339.1 thiamine-phosphate diphosphorylase [Alkalicoccus daliensis]